MQAKYADIAEIQKRIRKSLPHWYPDVTDSNASLIFVHEKEYHWSRHLLFRIIGSCSSEGQGILVKCLKAQDSQRRVGREILGGIQHGIRSAGDGPLLEYKALSLLYDHFGNGQLDGITAVRTLAHFADINTLVLEHVPGRNLLLLTLAAAKPWARRSTIQAAVDGADRAGRLAGALHQIKRDNYPRKEPFDREAYHKNLQIKVDILLNLSIGATARTRLNRALQTVRQLTSDFDEDVIVTYLHSDFYLDNFIVLPDGRVCTIDTMLEWTGPVEKDIAELFVFAKTPTQRLVGGAAIVRAYTLDRVIQAFIIGYRQRIRYSSRVLILYQLLALVQRWSSLLGSLREKSPGLIAPLFQRVRLEPFMLGYLDLICNHCGKEFCNE